MIDNKAGITALKESDYQVLFGVKKATFEKMLGFWKALIKLHARGREMLKLSVLDKLVIIIGNIVLNSISRLVKEWLKAIFAILYSEEKVNC